MRIHRIEFGLTVPAKLNRLRLGDVCHCGCLAFEFGPFYVTILRGECWPVGIVYGDEDVPVDDLDDEDVKPS